MKGQVGTRIKFLGTGAVPPFAPLANFLWILGCKIGIAGVQIRVFIEIAILEDAVLTTYDAGTTQGYTIERCVF